MKKHNKNTSNKKVVSIEKKNQRRAEAEARCSARRTRALKGAGLSDEQIEQLIADENARTILCIYYGSHTVNLGKQEVKTKKYNKKSHKFEPTKITKELILHGRAAAEYEVRQMNLDVLSFSPTSCVIKTTADKAEEIAETLRKKIGRCYITKHKRLPAKEEAERLNPKPEQKKSPTNNTREVRKAAKAKRKANNIVRFNARPYYAALRALKRSGDITQLSDDQLKNAIKERIRKYNHPLAEKIHAWLKDQQKKQEESKEYRAKHRQLTSIEMKSNKRAKKAVKHLATQERRKTREAKRATNNAKLHAERAQKAQKPVQTELKMTA